MLIGQCERGIDAEAAGIQNVDIAAVPGVLGGETEQHRLLVVQGLVHVDVGVGVPVAAERRTDLVLRRFRRYLGRR